MLLKCIQTKRLMSTKNDTEFNTDTRLKSNFNITLFDIAQTLFPLMTFLSTYSLIFDFIQNREQLHEAPVTDTTVKDAQKTSLYIATIPTFISAFIFSNQTTYCRSECHYFTGRHSASGIGARYKS